MIVAQHKLRAAPILQQCAERAPAAVGKLPVAGVVIRVVSARRAKLHRHRQMRLVRGRIARDPGRVQQNPRPAMRRGRVLGPPLSHPHNVHRCVRGNRRGRRVFHRADRVSRVAACHRAANAVRHTQPARLARSFPAAIGRQRETDAAAAAYLGHRTGNRDARARSQG